MPTFPLTRWLDQAALDVEQDRVVARAVGGSGKTLHQTLRIRPAINSAAGAEFSARPVEVCVKQGG